MTSFLPPLYFAQGGSTLRAVSPSSSLSSVLELCHTSDSSNATTSSSTPTTLTHDIELPFEMVHQIMAFCDWTDLARLSCVQTSWRTLLRDAANYNAPASKWDLAQFLLRDSSPAKSSQAMQLLLELANVNEDECDDTVSAPVVADDDNDDDEPLPLLSIVQTEHTEQTNLHGNNRHFAPAMKQIAHCYLHNLAEHISTKQSQALTGLKWLQRAHSLGGDVDAAHEVALLYEYGRVGVNNVNNKSALHDSAILIDIDVVLAAAWFRRAARAGHVDAMSELALCYELGCGVDQNDERALDWYMRAAERGHLTAKYSVGEAFEEARGVPQSDAEACLWYYKAALEGDDDSRKALKRLEDIARIVIPGVASLLDG